MAYQLLAMAQKRWRAIRSPHLVQQLLDGTKFLDGRPVEHVEEGERAAWSASIRNFRKYLESFNPKRKSNH